MLNKNGNILKGRDAIEGFCKKFDFKYLTPFTVNIFIRVNNKPIFDGNCKIIVKENYNIGQLEVECMDDSQQALKIGSKWNPKQQKITLENDMLLIVDKSTKITIQI